MPAQTGIQHVLLQFIFTWMPACAGMTAESSIFYSVSKLISIPNERISFTNTLKDSGIPASIR